MLPIFLPVDLGEFLELRPPRHRAVGIHDLAQHAGRPQRREPAQVDCRLGVAGARQHAAALRAQRKDVPGPREVRG